jgi:hypothetical protein
VPPDAIAQWFAASDQLPVPPTQYLFPGTSGEGEAEEETDGEAEIVADIDAESLTPAEALGDED